jgi:hypothetical protein
MANPSFTLYKHVKLESGAWRYQRAAYYPNHKIKPDVVLVTVLLNAKKQKREEKNPEGSYYLNHNGEWLPAGDDALEAQKQRSIKLNEAERDRLHGTVPSTVEVESKQSKVTLLSSAVTEYLEDIKLVKKKKTLSAYTTALTYFQESCKKKNVADVDRRVCGM